MTRSRKEIRETVAGQIRQGRGIMIGAPVGDERRELARQLLRSRLRSTSRRVLRLYAPRDLVADTAADIVTVLRLMVVVGGRPLPPTTAFERRAIVRAKERLRDSLEDKAAVK